MKRTANENAKICIEFAFKSYYKNILPANNGPSQYKAMDRVRWFH